MLELYLPDVKVPFQVGSNDAVEFLRGVQRVLAGLCGDLEPADWHQQDGKHDSEPPQRVNAPPLDRWGLTSIVFL